MAEGFQRHTDMTTSNAIGISKLRTRDVSKGDRLLADRSTVIAAFEERNLSVDRRWR